MGAHRSTARRTSVPLAIGAVAMLTALVEINWLSGVVAFGGAAIAGALNPDEPVRAGLLTVAFPILGGIVRTLLDAPSSIGLVMVSGALAAVFALIASHVGAGVQLRRLATSWP